MADSWITDLSHYLDEMGDIVSEPVQAKALAKHYTAIVLIGSYPEPEYPKEYIVKCRRRPKRKPCLGEIFGFIIPETDDIMWMCPKCNDRGLISNWRGSMWDLSNARVSHPE
jgi:hypothetical protein